MLLTWLSGIGCGHSLPINPGDTWLYPHAESASHLQMKLHLSLRLSKSHLCSLKMCVCFYLCLDIVSICRYLPHSPKAHMDRWVELMALVCWGAVLVLFTTFTRFCLWGPWDEVRNGTIRDWVCCSFSSFKKMVILGQSLFASLRTWVQLPRGQCGRGKVHGATVLSGGDRWKLHTNHNDCGTVW